MPDSISNITNTVIYGNTIWMIILSILVFVVLYFVVDLLLKKLDSLDKEESEKKWIKYLSKVMNKFPKRIFIVIEIYIAISFLSFPDNIRLILKAIFFGENCKKLFFKVKFNNNFKANLFINLMMLYLWPLIKIIEFLESTSQSKTMPTDINCFIQS